MEYTPTPLEDCFIVTPNAFEDKRGFFSETFNKKTFEKVAGVSIDFVQDNQSSSRKGVVRGLHFQKGIMAQAKLVRSIYGEILDVVVDLRKDSKTFGKTFSILLTSENRKQLFVPRGFAHGFIVLKDHTIFAYKCDNYYNKASESGIIYNDPAINIDWILPESEFILSEKDLALQPLKS